MKNNDNIKDPKTNEEQLDVENKEISAEEAEVSEDSSKEAKTEDTSSKDEPKDKKPSAPKKKGAGIKGVLSSGRFQRSTISILTSIVFIAIIVVINILVGALEDRFPSLNLDLTADKMNTLSDQALDVAKSVEKETEIIIIAEESYARGDGISNVIQYSQVTNLADKLAEANSKISVRFVDPDTNPTFINEYPDDALSTGKVLVRTDDRYKVLTLADLYTASQNSTTGSNEYYSQVDSALANAIYIANLDDVPILAVATGNNEMLSQSYLTGFEAIASSLSFEVKYIDLLTEEIPEETQILMIPTPTTDYTSEEIQKLRDFTETEGTQPHSVIFTTHPNQGELPNIAAFLEEWGVRVEAGLVVENDTSYIMSQKNYIFGLSAEEILADNTYSRLVAINNSPLSILFSSNNDISTSRLWVSSPSAYVIESDDIENPVTSEQTLATISRKLFTTGTYNNVLVFGSTEAFLETYSNNSTFSNKQYLTDIMSTIANVEESPVVTEQIQTNTLDISASVNTLIFWGLGVFTIGLPVLILVAGLVIFFKRRHL